MPNSYYPRQTKTLIKTSLDTTQPNWTPPNTLTLTNGPLMKIGTKPPLPYVPTITGRKW